MIAGSTSSVLVTRQLTGFPGRAKNNVDFGPCGWGWALGTVAKVVGLPGFMFNLPKWIYTANRW